MALKRIRYVVELALTDDAGTVSTEHELTILPADQMVAEQTGPRFGLPSIKTAPMSYQFLWMWAAARRQGVFTGEWPAFKVALLAYEDPDKSDDDPDGEDRPDLDPTTAAGSTSSR